jgi:hypothetical protein
VGRASGLLDDQVDGLGAAVAHAVGVEVGQDLSPPGPQGPPESGDLGDRAGGEGRDDLLGEPRSLGRCPGVIDRAQLPVAGPRDPHRPVRVTGLQAGLEANDLPGGQVLDAVTQQTTDLEGRVLLVSSTTQGVLLDAAADLVDHRAATFTGSVQGGRALAEIAARRRIPIPFFGELSSVNPVFVTPQALVQRRDTLAAGFVRSVAGSAGQLCTKPGFLFVPADAELRDAVARRSADQPEHRLLNPHTGSGYRERRDTILSTPGVRLVDEGTLRIDDTGETWATPTIVAVDVETLKHQRDRLLDEAFGPLSILVEYGDLSELTEVARELFPGNLTGTVHLGEAEELAAIRPLLVQLARSCGRVLVNDWPTGVAVTPAMQHGGPFPSTTNDSGTSVGTAAITRLMRPVAYQGVPEQLLPVPLRDSNPWSVPQRRTAPGESARWGQLRTPTSPG